MRVQVTVTTPSACANGPAMRKPVLGEPRGYQAGDIPEARVVVPGAVSAFPEVDLDWFFTSLRRVALERGQRRDVCLARFLFLPALLYVQEPV